MMGEFSNKGRAPLILIICQEKFQAGTAGSKSGISTGELLSLSLFLYPNTCFTDASHPRAGCPFAADKDNPQRI